MAILPMLTERLELREFKHEDFSAVQEYASDSEVTHYMIWGPNTEQDTYDYLEKVIKNQKDNPRNSFELAVVLRENQDLIGACGIYISNAKRWEGEIGYCFNKNYWKRGYASEASKAILNLGFRHLYLHRIYATCDPANVGSAKVLEKIGMKREGHLREHLLQRGKWRDSYLYAILEHEY